MAELRDEAEALAKALGVGACDVEHVVAWADSWIAKLDHPDPALCEVALAGNRYPQDVADLLRLIPGRADPGVVGGLLVLLLEPRLDDNTGRIEEIARVLYYLAHEDRIEDPALKSMGLWAWDAIDLAEGGYLAESRDEVVEMLTREIRRAAAMASLEGAAWDEINPRPPRGGRGEPGGRSGPRC